MVSLKRPLGRMIKLNYSTVDLIVAGCVIVRGGRDGVHFIREKRLATTSEEEEEEEASGARR